MASLTYVTNSQEDTALAFVLAKENARRAALNPPLGPLTAGQYFTAVIAAMIASYAQQAAAQDISDIKAQYDAATPAKQAAAKAAALAALT